MRRLTYALLLALALSAPVAAQPFFDAPWRAFGTGSWEDGRYTAALTTADVNDDGFPDAILGQHLFSEGLRVLLNQGDGTYGPPAAYPTSYNAWDVVAADLDGDGDPDLAASNADDYYTNGTLVATFMNDGSGAFGSPAYFNAGPSGPNGITAADFNGDGDTDLAVANFGWHGTGGAVSVLMNVGGRSFSAPAVYTVDPTAYRVEAGDLDGDGDADLVVAHDEYKVSLLFNNGAGAFGPPVVYDELAYPWTQPFYSDVSLADVEADGDLDVLYTNCRLYGQSSIDPQFLLLRNNGSGQLSAPIPILYQIPYENVAFDLEVADLNDDGYPDVLGAQMYEAGYIVIMNDGAGGFLAGHQYAGAGSAHVIVAADADGDGDDDVLTAQRLSRLLTVHMNPGDGRFPERPIHDRVFAHTILDLGDVDNDGDPDAVTSHGGATASSITVHRNTGGAFTQSHNVAGRFAYGKLRELNGDGNLDLLWVTGPTGPPVIPYDFWTAFGNGDGTFGAVVQHPLNACGLGHPAAFDVDADGDLDVINTEDKGCAGGGPQNRLFISRNNGNGTFLPPITFEGGLFPFNANAGDFNEDGHLDLVTNGYSASAILLGNGNGTFQPWAELPAGRVSQNTLVLDLDGDGHLDLGTLDLSFESSESHLSVFLGTGTGTFNETEYLDHPTQNFGGWVMAGDVDADGDDDLLTSGVQDAVVFLNDGNGAFTYSNGRYGLGKSGMAPHYADMDRDGIGDIVALVTHEWPPAGVEQGLIIVPGLEGTTAAVTVEAQPIGGPPVIGPDGGAFSFRVTLTNTTDQPRTVQAWTAVTGPVDREPVFGPMTVTVPAGATVAKTLRQRVPGAAPAGAYTYHARVGVFGGVVTASDAFAFTKQAGALAAGEATSADWGVSGWDAAASPTLPDGFALSEVHPNPFASQATLTLEVSAGQHVRAEVYDALGRRVAVLADGAFEAGDHAVVLDGSSLPAGVYVVRVTGETFVATRRATLVR